jgi:hypothetical protein
MFTSTKLNISLANYAAWESANLACGASEIYYGVDLVDCYSHAVACGVVFC